MSAAKNLNTWGLIGKIESTYGTYNTPASSDGILTEEPPEVTEIPIHDGSRVGRAPGTMGNWARVAQSGFESALSAILEGIGGGAAYSASVVPSIDILLRIAGFSATLDTTPGSESVTYAPESSGFESASLISYVRGEQKTIRGAYVGDFSVEVEGPGVPIWTFGVRGIRNAAATDIALPAITGYPAGTNLPPKAESITLSINSVTTMVVRSFRFNMNRELGARGDDNSTGHKGFTPGRANPTVEFTVEDLPVATYDAKVLRDAGTLQALSFVVGSTQYKKWTFASTQAQLISAEPVGDGPSAMLELAYELKVSGPTANDDLTFTWD